VNREKIIERCFDEDQVKRASVDTELFNTNVK
jgi:hypothetical protein